jgi:hypothetical protein
MSKPLLAIYGGLLAGLSFWAGQQYQRPVSSACTDPSWSATLPTCCKADVPHESRTVPSAIKAEDAKRSGPVTYVVPNQSTTCDGDGNCVETAWNATLTPKPPAPSHPHGKAPSANPAVVCGDMWDSTQGRAAYRCIPVAAKVEVQK